MALLSKAKRADFVPPVSAVRVTAVGELFAPRNLVLSDGMEDSWSYIFHRTNLGIPAECDGVGSGFSLKVQEKR